MKKYLGFVVLACAVVVQTKAQKMAGTRPLAANNRERTLADAKMSSQLYQLAKLAQADKTEAYSRLQKGELRHKGDNRMNVEIVFRNDANGEKINDRIDGAYLRQLGFEVDQTWKNRASVWILPEHLLERAALLSNDYFIFLVTVLRHDDEGPGVVNSSTYKTGGAPAGSGRRVAIFDGAFLDLQGAINAGKAKTPAYVGDGGNASTIAAVNVGSSPHGTACVETVYDHCPVLFLKYMPTVTLPRKEQQWMTALLMA